MNKLSFGRYMCYRLLRHQNCFSVNFEGNFRKEIGTDWDCERSKVKNGRQVGMISITY